MSKVHAVLLVPAEGDPHGLLREGPCGARPPMAFLWRAVGRWLAMSPGDETIAPRALVLAWGGEPVAEGLDRLARCLGWEPPGDGIDVEEMLDLWLSGLRTKTGTLVLLDAEGREVSDD